MTLGLDAAVVGAEQQLSCELSGEAVILNLTTGTYYGLNPVGARIWELLREPRTIREVRDVLLAEYDVDAAICERDVLDLIENMASRQLVQILNSSEHGNDPIPSS